MRFLPLLSSTLAPEPWLRFPALELRWEGNPGPWRQAVLSGLEIHALHFPEPSWAPESLAPFLEGLALQPDFLVVEASMPEDRQAQGRFLTGLELLLEALAGRGVRLVLRPRPGALGPLVALLREVRGEAVGFCWDPAMVDPEPCADRLCCAVFEGEDPSGLGPLRALGYRWNLALPASEPEAVEPLMARLRTGIQGRDFPPLPPDIPPVEGLSFGAAWGGGRA